MEQFIRAFTPAIVFTASFLVLTASALAGPPYDGRTPNNKLTLSDAEDFDFFGESVAVFGDFAIVGQSGGGEDPPFRQSAAIFDLTDGSEVRKLESSDNSGDDGFGSSVAISANFALVGATGRDGTGTFNQGAVYVFDLTDGSELFILEPSAVDASDNQAFGRSVAISGNLGIVGASGDAGTMTGNRRGAIYVFDLTTGNQVRKIVAGDGEDFDFLGGSLAVDGNIALAGASGEDGDEMGGDDVGAAYVFDISDGSELFKLVPDDPINNNAFFGLRLALSGSVAIVGAQNEFVGNQQGAAYFFDLTTGMQTRRIVDDTDQEFSVFGASVATNGTRVAVGAYNEDADFFDQGVVYVYEVASGELVFKRTAADASHADSLGFSVAVNDSFVVAGAFREDGDGGSLRGAAYVFHILQFQPDNLVGKRRFTGKGNDRYSRNGSGQKFTRVSRRLRQQKAFFTITNDGEATDDIRASARKSNRLFRVKYFTVLGGRRNITGALSRRGDHIEAGVDPTGAGRPIQALVKPKSRLRSRSNGQTRIKRKTFNGRFTSISTNDPAKRDQVIFRVRTR